MNPSLLQINPRVLLSTIPGASTLDDIPDSLLHEIQADGFDWVWLLGVWSIGPTSQLISRSNPLWLEEYRQTLPDLEESDICGSPFAIDAYTVDAKLGGDEALSRFRTRLNACGLKLLVDFIPNHVGFDHPWVQSHPQFFIEGSPKNRLDSPDIWAEVSPGKVYAYGRDPHYSGWPDTLQLNFFNPELRAAMRHEFVTIAQRADGVRCDMAMLIEPEIFAKTWSKYTQPQSYTSFWPETIRAARAVNPEFVTVAEVYWNYEWKLQQHGFNYTYDKTLYDRLRQGNPTEVRAHLTASLDYQTKLVRFLENHDEERAAQAFDWGRYRAAAVLSYLTPGLRLMHHGQVTGKKIRIPVHLKRGPAEQVDHRVANFYAKFIPIMNSGTVKFGSWRLLETQESQPQHGHPPSLIAFAITTPSNSCITVVNFGDAPKQGSITLPEHLIAPRQSLLHDLLSTKQVHLQTSQTGHSSVQISLTPWEACIFAPAN